MLFLTIILLVINLLGIFLRYQLNHDYVMGLIPLFNFDTEKNIPTLYSSFILILSAILLAFIATEHKRKGDPALLWFILSAIFIFLSIDEMSSIHENLIEPVRATLNTSGLLYYAWVIPYGGAVLVFLALYLGFIMRLQPNIRLLFILSGAIYVTGAIGFELIGGLQASLYGQKNVVYALITTSEELLEMVGIALFIYALNQHIITNFEKLNLTVKTKTS